MIQKQVTPSHGSTSTSNVTVSNGEEFFEIPSEDLKAAASEGFYLPADRGLTIVGDDRHLFEIPLPDARRAAENGYHDLLSSSDHTGESRRENRSHPDRRAEGSPSPSTASKSSGTGKQGKSPDARDVNTSVVISSLALSDEELEREREEQLQQLEETKGIGRQLLRLRFWLASHRSKLKQQLGGGGISLLVHVAVLLILASLFMASEAPKDVMLVSSALDEEAVEEVTFETERLEVSEPTETAESESTEVEEVSVDVVETINAPNFMSEIRGDAVKPPVKPASGESGDAGPKTVKKPTIFGAKFTAINYVFVIDNSNSMTKGRFETALHQLMLTVSQLTPKQRFYVIFYSDTAYPMMHPQAVLELVPATQRNKNALGMWLNTVQLCLKTNGMRAIQAAFDLQPDVIYVLGDGAFTDGAAKYFVRNPNKSVVVHTRGMEVSAKNAEAFRMLAETHRGTYRDVGVTQQGLLMAKQSPRPRNNIRGRVWGVTLPLNKKKP